MAFSGYIVYPIESEPQDLLDDAYTYIKSRVPEWLENDANLDTWILQIAASETSTLMTLVNDVPDVIFKWYGANLIGVPPLDATPAFVGSTWNVIDGLGYTIPEGTMVSIRDNVGVDHIFQVQTDIVIPASSFSASITLMSTEAGVSENGLGGNGVAATLIDVLSYVTSVVLTGTSASGQDAELSSDYNDRLARKLQRLSQRPILGSDYSLAALDVAGVYRALALDGYNPANQTSNNERYMAIAAVDSAGQPISSTIKTNLQTYLDSQRETNFVVNVFDPTVTQIAVTCNVKCLAGYTTATVQANALAALRAYLNPATWGVDPSITDASAQAQTWVLINKVVYNKIIDILATADGVDYVISMTMCVQGGSLGTADITLPGAAPLADDGTMNVTATP